MNTQIVEKTDRLNPAQFQRGTQRFVICNILGEFPNPVTVDEVVEAAGKAGYEKLLGEWAKEHGGVASSVRYHLRALRELGMVTLNTHSDAVSVAQAAADVQDSLETTFGLERDLQNALRGNIAQLQDGLKVLDSGKERSVPSGRIDILASALDGSSVVIELKAGTADRDAVGQILSYIGDLQDEAKGKIRGILVAGDFTQRAIAASRAVPNVELRRYGFKFSFQNVP